jgi:hypothetical protein
MGVKPDNNVGDDYPKDSKGPWTWNGTDTNIKIIKRYFDVISWEHGKPVDLRGVRRFTEMPDGLLCMPDTFLMLFCCCIFIILATI